MSAASGNPSISNEPVSTEPGLAGPRVGVARDFDPPGAVLDVETTTDTKDTKPNWFRFVIVVAFVVKEGAR